MADRIGVMSGLWFSSAHRGEIYERPSSAYVASRQHGHQPHSPSLGSDTVPPQVQPWARLTPSGFFSGSSGTSRSGALS
jgi:hypothetical protein